MMAKRRRDRYQSADDLIIDLECLLAGQPPKLARQRIEAQILAELAHGEAVEDDEEAGAPRRPAPARQAAQQVWILVLATLLGVSLLVNLFLALRPR